MNDEQLQNHIVSTQREFVEALERWLQSRPGVSIKSWGDLPPDVVAAIYDMISTEGDYATLAGEVMEIIMEGINTDNINHLVKGLEACVELGRNHRFYPYNYYNDEEKAKQDTIVRGFSIALQAQDKYAAEAHVLRDKIRQLEFTNRVLQDQLAVRNLPPNYQGTSDDPILADLHNRVSPPQQLRDRLEPSPLTNL